MEDSQLVDKILKQDKEIAIRNTHKKMVEKYPELKEQLDKILKMKLDRLNTNVSS